ncbi:MAG: OmpA family protein [Bacteroidales bacterium]|jgi:outer membrane protein OmpA-like peptidoglycan-associated protein|nr:OmpA family protein [Bacteroidales bacterium]
MEIFSTKQLRIYILSTTNGAFKNKGLRYIFSAFLFFCSSALFAQLPKNTQKSVSKAETEMAKHHYEKAQLILEKCYQKTDNNAKFFVKWKLEQCNFGIAAMQYPTNMLPINLGENINSSWDEYHPALTGDSKEILFTVRRPSDAQTVCRHCKQEEDIYSSVQQKGIWQPRTKLEKPVNTGYNEGAQSISSDGKYLFFTICNAEHGFGSCDIYWSKREVEGWSEPKNCGSKVNTRFWESQPSVSADGKTVYFASNRPGGYGGIDIWETEMITEGVFSEPVNLGKVINTPYDELSPFIHFDQKTLYFSSDGHLGMGGKDLFYSKLQPNGAWSIPKNLGYPINSYHDEMGIFINAQGNAAYFASDRIGGFGGLDIYCFELEESLRPEPTLFIVDNKENSENIMTVTDAFDSVKIGDTFILPNIFFEFAQSNLLPDSYSELQRLFDYLFNNKTVKIEISGHTDNQGSEDYNQKLSLSRAHTVYRYLVDKGIDVGRLSFTGYGKERPLAPNDSEENRAKNRRTEILILER